MTLKEPTESQCEKGEVVCDSDGNIARATYFPTMGQIKSKCLVVIPKKWVKHHCNYSKVGIEIYLWHNEEFPFHPNPAHIHIDDTKEFIEFGKTLDAWNEEQRSNNYYSTVGG